MSPQYKDVANTAYPPRALIGQPVSREREKPTAALAKRSSEELKTHLPLLRLASRRFSNTTCPNMKIWGSREIKRYRSCGSDD